MKTSKKLKSKPNHKNHSWPDFSKIQLEKSLSIFLDRANLIANKFEEVKDNTTEIIIALKKQLNIYRLKDEVKPNHDGKVHKIQERRKKKTASHK